MIGRLAGFFSILAGALVAAGAFANWVTLNARGTSTSYSGFTILDDHRDAIVSFGLAAALLFAGFVLSVRPVLAARLLGSLAGIGAAIWAGLLFFSLAPQAHALIAPSGPSPSTTIEIGLWITAGGGLLGLLTAFAAAVGRQRRVAMAPAPAAEAPRRSPAMGPAPAPGTPAGPSRTPEAPARTPEAPARTPAPTAQTPTQAGRR